jgi:lactoylglutathione lyase
LIRLAITGYFRNRFNLIRRQTKHQHPSAIPVDVNLQPVDLIRLICYCVAKQRANVQAALEPQPRLQYTVQMMRSETVTEDSLMKLNHLNLTVTDVVQSHQFLEKYFGLRGTAGNKNMSLLTDDNGIVLTLTSMKFGKESEVKYPASFHIGFIQESDERVDEINRRLREDGYDVPMASRQHGSWTFYFTAPGGFTVEVLH